jgi:hypothetical protein
MNMTDQPEETFLGQVSRTVDEIEKPPAPPSDQEKERIRKRERALLVDDIKREVLRDLASRGRDKGRYRQYLVSGIVCTWAALVHAVLRLVAPNLAIDHIESHMFADEHSEKWKAYWFGKSGQRMQAQLRRLYRRAGRCD